MVFSLFGYHGLFLNQSEMFCLFGEVPLLEPSAMRFGLFSITSGEHNWPTISGVQWSCLVVKDVFLKTLFLCTYRRSCLPALSLLDLVDGIGIGYLVSVVVLVLSCWFTHYLYISCAHGLCLLLLGTYINTFILFLPLKQNIYIGIGYLVSVVVLVLSCWFMHYLYISRAHGLCLLLLLGTYINTKLYICQRNSELR